MNICAVLTTHEGEVLSHPVHRQWLDDLGADELLIEKPQLPGPLTNSTLSDLQISPDLSDESYDIYIIEPPSALHALPELEAHDPDSYKIFLHTTWRLSGIASYNWSDWSIPMKILGGLDRTLDSWLLWRHLQNHIDGIITVSEMLRTQIQQNISIPVEVIPPHIMGDMGEQLYSITPNLDSQNVIILGEGRDHKGADILVDAWPHITREFPEAILSIIGDGHPDTYSNTSGVEVLGFVESLPEVFSQTSLAVHPARFDAFPVATLETMCAGIPTIVSNRTGTRSVARDVDPSLVVDPTPESVSKSVISYLELSSDSKTALSESARQQGSKFVETNSEKEFGVAVEELVSQLNS